MISISIVLYSLKMITDDLIFNHYPNFIERASYLLVLKITLSTMGSKTGISIAGF